MGREEIALSIFAANFSRSMERVRMTSMNEPAEREAAIKYEMATAFVFADLWIEAREEAS